MQVIEHTWIPMPDGVRLSVRLWLPEPAQKPVPAVLELIPYRKRDAYRDADDAWGAVLAAAGIAFARVDVRGTGDSEGVLHDEYSDQELADGETCIAWLAAQDWCSGNVGMRGISWGGINTLAVAARQPPALKAIVPMAAVANRFSDDAHYIGGRIGKPNLDWGVLFKTVLAGPADPEVVGESWADLWRSRLEETPAVVTEWLRHPEFDSYWQRGSVELDPAAIRCPVFLVAGWQDTYLNFVSTLLGGLTAPVQALIGPWGHTYPGFARPQAVDWATEEVSFWRRWLLAEALPPVPALRAFLPTQTARQAHPDPVPGIWHQLSALPETRQSFCLGQGTLLSTPAEPLGSPISWRETEPVGFASAEWLDRLPVEQSRDDALSLCFDSEPLEAPLALLGRASLELELSELAGRVLTVRLCDLDQEDRSWLVTYATLDFRFADDPKPEQATQKLQFELRLAGHVFQSGHRLRLALSGGLWPMTWPAPDPTGLTLVDGSLALPVLEEAAASATAEVAMKVRSAPPPEPLPAVSSLGQGRYRYVVEQPAYEYEVSATGTRLSGEGRFVAELGRHGASRWQASARRAWQRQAWRCAVVAAVSLERTGDGLLAEESLQAFADGQLIFERQHSELLPDPDSVGAD